MNCVTIFVAALAVRLGLDMGTDIWKFLSFDAKSLSKRRQILYYIAAFALICLIGFYMSNTVISF